MTNIFTQSPYIIEINEASQVSTKLELFIVGGAGTLPTSPSYTLSKLIASSNVPSTTYDISPYIREFMTFNNIVSAYDSDYLNTNQFAQVQVKRYKTVGTTETLIDTTNYYAFDGYGYYEEGSNADLGRSLMTEGTYYYLYDSSLNFATDFLYLPSSIGVPLDGAASEEYKATYTNLVSGATSSVTKTKNIMGGGTYNFPRQFQSVLSSNYADGNKVEIIDNLTSFVLATYYFYPKEACKYTPVKCDFVNKFGQFQRLWFYKAKNESISVKSSEYKSLQSSITSYNQTQGQKKEFNINAIESIKVNTDWVDESFNDILKEIMLSEKILIDDKPAKLKTKSTELFNNINTKQINYTLEFEYNFNTINNVK